MLSRSKALFVALGFVAGFILCLSLDLHGAFAVACALGFLVFTSAAIDKRTKILRLIKRVVGAMIIGLTIIGLNGNPDQNPTFVVTLVLCGIILFYDRLVLWLTRPPQ